MAGGVGLIIILKFQLFSSNRLGFMMEHNNFLQPCISQNIVGCVRHYTPLHWRLDSGQKTRPKNVFLETLIVSKIGTLNDFQPFWLGAFQSIDPSHYYTHPISNLI